MKMLRLKSGAFFLKTRIFFFLSLGHCAHGSADTNSCGETFSTKMNEHVFSQRRLKSRVVESQLINRPLECYVNCLKNCRCLSYNICNGGKLCELNSEKKENNASLFVQNDKCDYHEYAFSKMSHSGECGDPCCTTSNPCLRGGRCYTTCMKNNKRFNCEGCPKGYGGIRCETKATSCASYVQSSNKTHGLRVIYAPDNSNFSVFCHFTPQYAMTLVMSFVRKTNGVYKEKSLSKNFPRSEKGQNWADYRLSLAKMENIRDHGSTHWMYTCSYETRGFNKTDYLRSKFSETDIITFMDTPETRCKQKLEYVNIQGQSCENCSAVMRQGTNSLFWISAEDITCGGLTGMHEQKCGVYYAGYFSARKCTKTKHSCSRNKDATTQLWFAQFIG